MAQREDERGETSMTGEEVTPEEHLQGVDNISQFVINNQMSTNTQLFSMLALLKAYLPESYLLMAECQQVLGPPDPIHGGPPFEERMEPFTDFITTSSPTPGDVHVSMTNQICAQRAVELLAHLRISRSSTVESLFLLCGDEPQPHLIQFIKDLLTKREMREEHKTKFSRLIVDILKHENFHQALCVLRKASYKFQRNAIFPQTVSRLNYNEKPSPDFERAEDWAKRAIRRAPHNSYMADTLGQIYKNCLRRQRRASSEVLQMTEKALKAFKDVERKAEVEKGPGMEDTAGTVSISVSFNNRGLFGFIQVANLAFDKLPEEQLKQFIQNKKEEVEKKFDFFEWYLTYSKPDKTTSEPRYFWKDVALCYKQYTTKTASESTSFPGLLDCLNHGLFTSKGRRAQFVENEKTVSDLEAVQRFLKSTYEENVDDVKAAERYILSNIILSNRKPLSPQLTPVRDLQTIIHRFLGSDERRRSPEFCLLVLLLFWPEQQVVPKVVQEKDDEEVDKQATEDSTEDESSEDETSEDETSEDEDRTEDQETRGEPAQQPLDHVFQPNLQQYVTFMEKAYQRAKYAKYLRGRYLVPLFFLGKGSGLSKWIHKSRLDAIVERKVEDELAAERHDRNKKKVKRINNMWITGEVWQEPEIQDILLPVQVEPHQSNNTSHEHKKEKVRIGGQTIEASVEGEPKASVSPKLLYLGFNIQGPVLFQVQVPAPDISALMNTLGLK